MKRSSGKLKARLDRLRELAEKRGALKVRKAFIVLRPDEDIPEVDYRVKGYTIVSPEDWPQTGDVFDIDFDSEEDVVDYARLCPAFEGKSEIYIKQLMAEDLELFRELCQWEPDEEVIEIELDPAPTVTSSPGKEVETPQEAPSESPRGELVEEDVGRPTEPVLDEPEEPYARQVGEDGLYGDQRRRPDPNAPPVGDEPSVTRDSERGWETWRG